MEKIKRFDVDWRYEELEEDDEGYLMFYEDHERIVKKLEKKITILRATIIAQESYKEDAFNYRALCK
jgi:hypothetical protein